jgi:hypothetical protein
MVPGEVVFRIKTLRDYPNGTLNPETDTPQFVVADNGTLIGTINLDKVVGQGRASYEEGSEEWNLHMKWLNTPMGNLIKHMFENGRGISFEVTPVGVGSVKEGVVQKDYKLLGFNLVSCIKFDD